MGLKDLIGGLIRDLLKNGAIQCENGTFFIDISSQTWKWGLGKYGLEKGFRMGVLLICELARKASMVVILGDGDVKNFKVVRDEGKAQGRGLDLRGETGREDLKEEDTGSITYHIAKSILYFLSLVGGKPGPFRNVFVACDDQEADDWWGPLAYLFLKLGFAGSPQEAEVDLGAADFDEIPTVDETSLPSLLQLLKECQTGQLDSKSFVRRLFSSIPFLTLVTGDRDPFANAPPNLLISERVYPYAPAWTKDKARAEQVVWLEGMWRGEEVSQRLPSRIRELYDKVASDPEAEIWSLVWMGAFGDYGLLNLGGVGVGVKSGWAAIARGRSVAGAIRELAFEVVVKGLWQQDRAQLRAANTPEYRLPTYKRFRAACENKKEDLKAELEKVELPLAAGVARQLFATVRSHPLAEGPPEMESLLKKLAEKLPNSETAKSEITTAFHPPEGANIYVLARNPSPAAFHVAFQLCRMFSLPTPSSPDDPPLTSSWRELQSKLGIIRTDSYPSLYGPATLGDTVTAPLFPSQLEPEQLKLALRLPPPSQQTVEKFILETEANPTWCSSLTLKLRPWAVLEKVMEEQEAEEERRQLDVEEEEESDEDNTMEWSNFALKRIRKAAPLDQRLNAALAAALTAFEPIFIQLSSLPIFSPSAARFLSLLRSKLSFTKRDSTRFDGSFDRMSTGIAAKMLDVSLRVIGNSSAISLRAIDAALKEVGTLGTYRSWAASFWVGIAEELRVNLEVQLDLQHVRGGGSEKVGAERERQRRRRGEMMVLGGAFQTSALRRGDVLLRMLDPPVFGGEQFNELVYPAATILLARLNPSSSSFTTQHISSAISGGFLRIGRNFNYFLWQEYLTFVGVRGEGERVEGLKWFTEKGGGDFLVTIMDRLLTGELKLEENRYRAIQIEYGIIFEESDAERQKKDGPVIISDLFASPSHSTRTKCSSSTSSTSGSITSPPPRLPPPPTPSANLQRPRAPPTKRSGSSSISIQSPSNVAKACKTSTGQSASRASSSRPPALPRVYICEGGCWDNALLSESKLWRGRVQVTDDPQDVQFVVATSWNCDNSDFARVTQNPQVRLMKPTWLDRWGLEGNDDDQEIPRPTRG